MTKKTEVETIMSGHFKAGGSELLFWRGSGVMSLFLKGTLQTIQLPECKPCPQDLCPLRRGGANDSTVASRKPSFPPPRKSNSCVVLNFRLLCFSLHRTCLEGNGLNVLISSQPAEKTGVSSVKLKDHPDGGGLGRLPPMCWPAGCSGQAGPRPSAQGCVRDGSPARRRG